MAQDAALSPWGVCRNRKPGRGGLTKQYLLSCPHRLVAQDATLSPWGVCRNRKPGQGGLTKQYLLSCTYRLAASGAALSPWGVCQNQDSNSCGGTFFLISSKNICLLPPCPHRLAASGAALSSWGVCQNQHSNSCGGYNQSIILSFSHFYQFSFNGCILIVSTFLKVNLRLSQPQKGNFSSATFLQSQDCCFQANGQ